MMQGRPQPESPESKVIDPRTVTTDWHNIATIQEPLRVAITAPVLNAESRRVPFPTVAGDAGH